MRTKFILKLKKILNVKAFVWNVFRNKNALLDIFEFELTAFNVYKVQTYWTKVRQRSTSFPQ